MISNAQLEKEFDEKFLRWQRERHSQVLKPSPLQKVFGSPESLAGLRTAATEETDASAK